MNVVIYQVLLLLEILSVNLCFYFSEYSLEYSVWEHSQISGTMGVALLVPFLNSILSAV
jgi:hypothetical protein